MKQILFCILNGKAGAKPTFKPKEIIAKIAGEHGREVKFSDLGRTADLKSIVQQAEAAEGVVVAGGGDGTISAVAASVAGTDVPLGVLPMGTLNHFAKDLGVPLAFEEAVSTLFTGIVRKVDVGEVNGHVFINNSSIGFYPRIVREREREQRQGSSKWVALAKASARIFQSSHTMHVDLKNDHNARQFYETPFLFVGNNRYSISGFEIGTRPTLNGGKLWLCAAPNAGRAKLFKLAVEAIMGRVRDGDLAALETDQINVRMRRPHVHVATDGEVSVMKTPLRYQSRPGALRVIVPAQG